MTTVIGALCVGKPSDVKVSLASEVPSIWAILLRFTGDYRLICAVWAILLSFSGDYRGRCALFGQSFSGSVVTTVGGALCVGNPSEVKLCLPSEVRCLGNPSEVQW